MSFPSSLSRTLRSFAYDTMVSRTDFTMESLGLKWVLERRQQNGSEYASIRQMFHSQFPNYALLLLKGASEESLQDSPENNRSRYSIGARYHRQRFDVQWFYSQVLEALVLSRLNVWLSTTVNLLSIHRLVPLILQCFPLNGLTSRSQTMGLVRSIIDPCA